MTVIRTHSYREKELMKSHVFVCVYNIKSSGIFEDILISMDIVVFLTFLISLHPQP